MFKYMREYWSALRPASMNKYTRMNSNFLGRSWCLRVGWCVVTACNVVMGFWHLSIKAIRFNSLRVCPSMWSAWDEWAIISKILDPLRTFLSYQLFWFTLSLWCWCCSKDVMHTSKHPRAFETWRPSLEIWCIPGIIRPNVVAWFV